MGISLFSEEFYNQILFQNGERAYLTDEGTFAIKAKESKWNRFKRVMTFKQDDSIDKAHEKLKALMKEVKEKSGSQFMALKEELHAQGEEKFDCLEKNLKTLRGKLDRIGQLNFFSKQILKVFNVIRSFLHESPIQMKTYATMNFFRPEVPWMANYSIERSFSINSPMFHLKEDALKLTEKDKESCFFSTTPDSENESFQKLEKGLMKRWWVKQICKNYSFHCTPTGQIFINLDIIFDSEKQKFLIILRKHKENQKIEVERFKEEIKGLTDQEKTVQYKIQAKDSEGNKKELKLVWSIENEEEGPYRAQQSSVLDLEVNVPYEIYDENNKWVISFTLGKKDSFASN
jgi:hypothetical protein